MQFLRAFICLIFTIFSINNCAAFKIMPFGMTLHSNGDMTRDNIIVTNTGDNTEAIEVSVESRDMDRDGKEINEDASNLFIIYPSQVVLRPGESQNVRVQYIGESAIDHEMAYRLNAEQLPLEFIGRTLQQEEQNTANGSLDVLIKYRAGLYILPEDNLNAKPKLEIKDVKYQGNILKLTLYNKGDKHIILDEETLQLFDNGKHIHWDDKALTTITNVNLLADRTIDLELPVERKLHNYELKLVK